MKKIGQIDSSIGKMEINIGWIIPPVIIEKTNRNISIHLILPFFALSFEYTRKKEGKL